MPLNYINHIALVLDASTSMRDNRAAETLPIVADALVQQLATRSQELDQETRVTIYTFADTVQCLLYDKDVLRLPSIASLYKAAGNTALIDATLKAIADLKLTATLYGDHAFLIYVLTDGQENRSKHAAATLASTLTDLKDNWTLAAFVPDARGLFEAKKFGFPAGNVAVWDPSAKGVSEVGEVIRKTTDGYFQMRAQGIRGTRGLFTLDTQNLQPSAVAKAMQSLHPGQYRLFTVDATWAIAQYVEQQTGRAYRLGEAYYQLVKPEAVQPQKLVALLNTKDHKVYAGREARDLLKLPDYEVKVAPAAVPGFDIFIQSTSVNRKLYAGSKLLLLSQ